MQTRAKTKRRRSGIYFSSEKARRSSRMARMKGRVEEDSIRKVLDFDEAARGTALDVVVEEGSQKPTAGYNRRYRKLSTMICESDTEDEVCVCLVFYLQTHSCINCCWNCGIAHTCPFRTKSLHILLNIICHFLKSFVIDSHNITPIIRD